MLRFDYWVGLIGFIVAVRLVVSDAALLVCLLCFAIAFVVLRLIVYLLVCFLV